MTKLEAVEGHLQKAQPVQRSSLWPRAPQLVRAPCQRHTHQRQTCRGTFRCRCRCNPTSRPTSSRFWRSLAMRFHRAGRSSTASRDRGQARQPPRYILVIGAGYSGTGGLAQLLTSLGLPVSHEAKHPDRLNTSGLSSWPSTVLGNAFRTEPWCREHSVFLQVRHPRSVVRSALGSAWNFKATLDVKDYVPQEYAKVWPQLSTEIKALLW